MGVSRIPRAESRKEIRQSGSDSFVSFVDFV
jgi:hypothetical protein